MKIVALLLLACLPLCASDIEKPKSSIGDPVLKPKSSVLQHAEPQIEKDPEEPRFYYLPEPKKAAAKKQ